MTMEPAKLKVVELKAELTSRGLAAKGKKADLIKALGDALAAEAAAEAAAAAAAEPPVQDRKRKRKGKAGQADGQGWVPKAQPEQVASSTANAAASGKAAAAAAAAAAKAAAVEEMNIKFGGVLLAGTHSLASQRVPKREGVRPGEGSTKIRGTQRLARDSGTHEFFGPSVEPAVAGITIKRGANKPVALGINRPGITKSGRHWRAPKTQRASAKMAVPHLRTTWEQKMAKKAEKKAMQAFQQVMRDERQELIDRQKLERENKRKQKAANREKSVVVQVVKNPMKLKKLKRSQMRMIRKGADPNAPAVQQV